MNQTSNLLTIFVLLICSTCAQAQFDTIINLPEAPTNPNPSGFSGNSIGDNAEIFSNTQLNVSDGGSVGNFLNLSASDPSSSNIEVNISGGTIGDGFESGFGSTVNISGGTVDGFRVGTGSVANISDGAVNFLDVAGGTVNISDEGGVRSFSEANGGTINITGGRIDDDFGLFSGTLNIFGGVVGSIATSTGGNPGNGTINLSGGIFESGTAIGSGNTINISGGTVSNFSAFSGSEVNVFGTEFFLSGTPVDNLILGDTAILELGEGVALSGLLADGTPFDFSISPNSGIRPGATLTVTLVPEPGIGLPLAMTSILSLSRRRKIASTL